MLQKMMMMTPCKTSSPGLVLALRFLSFIYFEILGCLLLSA